MIDASLMPTIVSGNTNAAVPAAAAAEGGRPHSRLIGPTPRRDYQADQLHRSAALAVPGRSKRTRGLLVGVSRSSRARLTVQAAVHELEDYLIGKDPFRSKTTGMSCNRGGFYRGGAIHMSAISGT